MKELNGIIVAILGGVLGVAGYYFYESANRIISRGERLGGAGWFYEDITPDQALLFQIGGITGMVIGGIVILAGIIIMLRRS